MFLSAETFACLSEINWVVGLLVFIDIYIYMIVIDGKYMTVCKISILTSFANVLVLKKKKFG